MPLASRTGMVTYRIKDAYYIVTSVSQVYQTSTGVFNPSVFRVYAYKGKLPAVGMYLQCWGSTDNINWTYITYKVLTETLYYIDITVKAAYKYYIVRLYDHNPSTDIYDEPNFYSSASVSVIKDGEPGAQGNPGAKMRMRTWASGTYYMRGVGDEEWYDVVEYEGRLYLCRVSHTASSSNSPATDTGYWETAQNWTFIATKLLIAGKIVSGKITADLIDADGITAKDVNLTGKITATSGKIGGWRISGNNLECIGSNAQIYIGATKAGYMTINDSDTIMCSIRASGKGTGLHISNSGSNDDTICLSLLCNAGGKGKAIDSTGNVSLIARSDERIVVHGLSLNSRTVTSSANIYTNDDIIIANNGNDITLYLSTASIPGKMIYIKRKGTGKVTVKGNIICQDANTMVTSLDITDYPPRLFIYHGSYWYEFSGRH